MWSHPALGELLWEAYIGARGWVLGIAVLGSGLLIASLVLTGTTEPRAVAMAFFIPLFLAGIMGATSLSAYRVRHSHGAARGFAVRIFLAALIWNLVLAVCALVVDRIVVYYGLLSREPFAFPESVGVVGAFASVLALLAVYPARGPS